MSTVLFLSCVSDEFLCYRGPLREDFARHDVDVKVPEDFKEHGDYTIDKLDRYVQSCDAVVHLVGELCGATPGAEQRRQFFAKHHDLAARFPALGDGEGVTYTQWEAWLALYRGKQLLIAKARDDAPRGAVFPTDATRAAQAAHISRLKEAERYPSFEFSTRDELAKHLYASLLDLLRERDLQDFAAEEAKRREAEATGRQIAEGFIREMAGRVARAENLDLEGMKRAVSNAIDIYVNEIAGQPTATNVDDIVARALERAKAQFDKGQSALADATLARAADEMEREEREHRERFEVGVTQLRTRQRDLALAAFQPERAAEAILVLGRALHGRDAKGLMGFWEAEAEALHQHGETRGSNVHLLAEIPVRRVVLDISQGDDAKGRAKVFLGIALHTLGARESGTARLEEAVAAYRAALEDFTRERVPLDWAMTQNNLGSALQTLGARESGTARLEEAVAAYRAALEDFTRERVPLDWAGTQNNLGNALRALGARESGTARLEEAVAAYRAALEEYTRRRVPLDWAITQNNLGIALATLGERESGTARLEEAVAAYRAALEERTCERVPLGWAGTQNNLAAALQTLGERESGTARLEEAVATYLAALEERTRERVPLEWAATQNNLANALQTLGARESGTERLGEAVAAYRAALEEHTHKRFPLLWATTQNNLGTALAVLGERESGTARLEEAVAAYRAALEERTRERVSLNWAGTQNNLGNALRTLGERESGTARLVEAVAAYRAALEEFTPEQAPHWHGIAQSNLDRALELIRQRSG